MGLYWSGDRLIDNAALVLKLQWAYILGDFRYFYGISMVVQFTLRDSFLRYVNNSESVKKV